MDTILHKNERDVEIPSLLNFIKSRPDIKSLLDVGCHYSETYYAKELRLLLDRYDGIDILPISLELGNLLDVFTANNIKDPTLQESKLKWDGYDCVICVSSIEHSGITTYKVEDYKQEQLKVFSKLIELSNKYIFLTFPFGKEALHEGQFDNITNAQLMEFSKIAKAKSFKYRFYFSEFPQGGEPWREISLTQAREVEYLPEKGTRCVCILEIEK